MGAGRELYALCADGSELPVEINLTQIDVSTMSPDDAMLIVQADRVKLCESELNAQIKTIQAKNEQMRKLNTLQATLAQAKAMFGKTDNDAWLRDQSDFKNFGSGRSAKFKEFENDWIAAGLDPSYVGGAKTDPNSEGSFAKGDVQYKTFEAMSTSSASSVPGATSSSGSISSVRWQWRSSSTPIGTLGPTIFLMCCIRSPSQSS